MVAQLQLQKLWPQAHIATADSGEQALQQIATQHFDVALFDMVMPGMDGLQLTSEVRERFPDKAARMPILALTANTHPAERERCLAAGMDGVLHKPIETDELVRCVSTLIVRSRA
jgi:CheY-like chemotaxis protein